ncbi:MAG: tetratricopeptide repeat protein, partial [Chloroflexi bacterium]|nr:tetratricopeptide repeat protein [Chloroflexota bacterium]
TLPRPPSQDFLPSSARIDGVLHQQQTWNNCGPATITMALSYHGWRESQAFAGDKLKPNREDKNVSPHELVDFVREESFVDAILRVGGTLDLLKRLVANGFPTVIETAAMFEGYDWIGHYRVLVGYDDAFQLFYFYDSFLGVGADANGVTESYARVDNDWRAFNRTFIVVYHPDREALLRNILAEYWDEAAAAQIAFEAAQNEARSNPQDAFAWFNMGSSLAMLGRHQEAAAAFDQATSTGKLPWRMMWYQHGAFAAYFAAGRYQDVLTLAAHNQNTAPELEETHYWRGRVYEAQGENQRAASAYRRALGYNPNYDAARQALDSLSQ